MCYLGVGTDVTSPYGWWTILLVLVVAGMGTYLLRLSVIMLVGQVSELPPQVSSTLAFVPPAVLAALAVDTFIGMAFVAESGFLFDPGKAIAGGVGVVVAWWSRNVLATIAAGMIVLWLVQVLVA